MTNSDQPFEPDSTPQPNTFQPTSGSQPGSYTPSPAPSTQQAQPATYSSQSGGYGQFGSYQAQAATYNSGYGTVIPLRPLGIGDTLDATFRLLKFNPVAYFVFPLILFLIFGIVEALLSLGSGEIDVNDPFGAAVNDTMTLLGKDLFISLPLSIAISGIVMIVTTRITVASVRGRKVSLKETFAMIKPRGGILLLRLIAFEILVSIVIFASLFIIVGIIVLIVTTAGVSSLSFSSSDTSTTFALLGIIIFVIVISLLLGAAYFAFYLRFALAPSAMVVEDIGPFKAIARSWRLTKGSFGYLLGTVITVVLITSMVSTAIIMPISILAVLFSGPTGTFITSIGSSVAISIALTPIQGVLMNLLYVNMRFKRENLHLALLAEHQA